MYVFIRGNFLWSRWNCFPLPLSFCVPHEFMLWCIASLDKHSRLWRPWFFAHKRLFAGYQRSGQSLAGQSIPVHSQGAAFAPRDRWRWHRSRAVQLHFHKWEIQFYFQSFIFSHIYSVDNLVKYKGHLSLSGNVTFCFSFLSESWDEGTTWLLFSSRLAPHDGMYQIK